MAAHVSRSDAGSQEQLSVVRQIVQLRRRREQILGETLFSDPAWDMLLELYASWLDQRRMSVMDVCAAAPVPTSTGLRWLAKIVNEGLAIRRGDELDGRRSWIELTERGLSSMDCLVAEMHQASA
jgi:DNA-binding MarR family transcriptional regulator